MSDVSVVVVTYNGLPWIEQALESVHGVETVLVDNGSTDGTVAFVREHFPEVVVAEQENRGLAAGWNAGVARTSSRYVLLLNSDAWLDAGALDALVAFADAHPAAAVVGPRLRNADGSLQRSVRGFPTLWRLATEYLFLYLFGFDRGQRAGRGNRRKINIKLRRNCGKRPKRSQFVGLKL